MQPSPDGLRRIRQATAARERRPDGLTRRVLMAAAAGVVLGGGTAGGILTTMRRGSEDALPGQGDLTSEEVTNDVGEAPPPGGPWKILTAYVVKIVDGHPRLVPERRRVSLDEEVGTRFLAQTPVGADHGTYWRYPLTYALAGTRDEPVIIYVRSAGFGSPDVNSVEEATVAIQQLVWTVTENDFASDDKRDGPVTILVDGKRGYRAWNLVTLDKPVRRDPSLLA